MGFFDRFKKQSKHESADAQWQRATGAKTRADKAYEKATGAKRVIDVKPKKPKASKSPAGKSVMNDQAARINRAVGAMNMYPMDGYGPMSQPASGGKKKRGGRRGDGDMERMMRGDLPDGMGGLF